MLVNPAGLRRYLFDPDPHEWGHEICRGCGRRGWRAGERPRDGRATGVFHKIECEVAGMLCEPSVDVPPADAPYGPQTREETERRIANAQLHRDTQRAYHALLREVYRTNA